MSVSFPSMLNISKPLRVKFVFC